ncbi:MAG: tetratricopeptide repeat protein [SAR324 cluster bacterium]|nr:tetratricopeptide repeat protein [SAR324 cluster bacterium]
MAQRRTESHAKPRLVPAVASAGLAALLLLFAATAGHGQFSTGPGAEALYRQAMGDLRAERPVDAEWKLLEALRSQPRHFRSHVALGRFYRGRLPDLALAHLRVARRIRPASDQVYVLLGRLLEARGQLMEAAEHFRQAVRLNARHYEANNRLRAILRTFRERKSVLERGAEQFWRKPNLASLTLYGRMVMAESTPRQALFEFESIRDRLPELPEVQLWIARSHRLLGSVSGEIEAYRRYLAQSPDSSRVRLVLAERLVDTGRYSEASTTLEPLMERLTRSGPLADPELQARTALLESRSLVAQGQAVTAGDLLLQAANFGMDTERIAEAFSQYVALFPDVAALRLSQGYWLRSTGRHAESATAFYRAGMLGEAPRQRSRLALQEMMTQARAVNEALLGLGEFALLDGREPEAVRYLSRVAAWHPANRRASLLLGVVARHRGDLEESLDAFMRYVFSFSDPAAMVYARGNLFWELGQPDVAEAIWGEEPRLIVRFPEILARLAGYYGERHERAAELAAREVLRDLLPTRLANRKRLGQMYLDVRRDENAAAEWESIVALLPGDYDLRVKLAKTLLRLGRRASALEQLLQAANIRPLTPELNELLAGELFAQRRYAEALDLYWQIYQRRPDHPDLPDVLPTIALEVPSPPEVRLVAARMAERAGRTEIVMELLEETLRQYPEQEEARVMLAGIHLTRDEAEEAERVIAAGPGQGELSDLRRLGILAEAQLRQEKNAAAAETLGRMVELDPQDTPNRRRLGLLLNGMERHEEAIPVLSVVIEREPADTLALLRLAQSELAGGRQEGGKAHLRGLLALEPHHEEGLSLLIARLLQERLWKEVAPTLETWVELHPRDSVARYNLITAYLRLFDRDSARGHFETLTTLNPVQARRLAPYFR